MKNKFKIETGITVIALIITIIILLILSGVSIAILTGENGIFKTAQNAKVESQKGTYREIIELAKNENEITTDRERTKSEKLDGISEILNKDKNLGQGTGTEITKEYQDKENPRLVVKTKEGWVYIVTVDGIKELGKVDGDIPLDVDIKNGDIKYTYEPNYWTNSDVEVSLNIVKEEYKEFNIQYSYDLKTWKDYTEKIVAEKNKAIYSRITTGTSASESYATGNIINIDKTEAEISTALNSSKVTTKGFTVNVGVTDENSGLGKIVWYYKKSNETTYNSEEVVYKELHSTQSGERTSVTKSKTYDNLTSGTYDVYAEIYDVAGNVTSANSSEEPLEITLGNVETATGGSYSPAEWTNGNVTVTLPTKEGFTTRYTIDKTIPTTSSTEYTDKFTVSNNCTITYIYTDGTNIGGAGTLNVGNIDKDKPTIGTISGAFTIVSGNTGNIIISSIADTGGSGLSGIYISTSSTKPTETSVTWISNTSSSYSKSVTAAGTYYVWVKDTAGNVSDSKTCKVSTVAAIARVGSVYYSSITNAISSISSSGTVVMCTNTTEDPIIPSGKNITLNMNSKTITGRLTNNGTAIITGSGTILSNRLGDIAFRNYGTATLQSGTIQLTKGGWTLYNTGTFNMLGGNISTTSSVAVMNNKTFNMSAGTLNGGGGYALVTRESNAVSTVTGGTIKNTSTSTYASQTDESGSLYIKNTTITSPKYALALAHNNNVPGRIVRIIDCNISGTIVNNTTNPFTEVLRTSTGYNIYYYDTISSVSAVQFPTWTTSNGQDDIVWHQGQVGTRNESRCFWYGVQKSEHKNEIGEYTTHVYVDNVAKDAITYKVK